MEGYTLKNYTKFLDTHLLTRPVAICAILVLTFFRSRIPTIDLVIYPYFLYIFAGIVAYKNTVNKTVHKDFRIGVLLLFLLNYFLISLYHLATRRASVFATWDVILNLGILFFVFYLNSNETKESLRAELNAISNFYIGFCTLLCSAGFIAMVNNVVIENFLGFDNYYIGLLNSRFYVLTHPNGLGLMLVVSLLLILYQFLSSKKAWKLALYGLLGLINYVALVLTQSRNALFCFFAGVFLVLFFAIWDCVKNKSLKQYLPKILAFAIVFVLLLSAYALFYQKAPESGVEIREIDEKVGSLNSRTYIWQSAIQLMIEQPSRLLHGLLVDGVIGNLVFKSVNAHNTWLEILLISGLLGLLLILYFFIPLVWRMLKALFASHPINIKVLIAIVFVILASSLLESNLVFNSDVSNHIFFVILGFVVRYLILDKEGKQKST